MVEDESVLADALVRGLSAQGFVTAHASDGRAAVEKLMTRQFDAAIVDIMLPGMNGYDVCKTVRAADVDVAVLMLTAKDGEFDEVDAFDVGADDYLTKPFSFPVLVARLRAVSRRAGSARPPSLTAGDLVADPGSHEVRIGEASVSLTPREFSVLECLLRHRDLVVSKLQIAQEILDVEHDGADNLIEVYIAQLRRKIDDPFGVTSIHTVRGRGYRLSRTGP